ncbi:MAG: HAMP domain-containing protein [Myxococcales bacterium]|nr:HAMP domain-containing protein [Myxococcales bacterium]
MHRFSLSTRIFIAFAIVVAAFGTAAAYGVATTMGLRHELGFLRKRTVPLLRTLRDNGLELRGFDEALQRAAPHDLDWVARFVPNARPFRRLDGILSQIGALHEDARPPRLVRLLVGPPAPVPAIGQDLVALRTSRDAAMRMARDTALLPLLGPRFEAATDEVAFSSLVTALQRAVADKRYTDAARLVVEIRRIVRRIHRGVEGVERQLESALNDRFAQAQQSEARLGIVVASSAAIALLVAVIVLLVMVITLRPMAALAEVVRRFAAGERTARADTGGAAEIRQLAVEYNRMADALAEREREIAAQREDLARSERLATLGHMAARVVHEIRNPLSSIGLNAELLADELDDSDEARELLNAIGAEVERLRNITEGYLQRARPTPQIEKRVTLSLLLTRLADFARAELAERGVSAHVSAQDGVSADIDPRMLRQALWNLVRNAWEAMPDGGTVWVEARHGGVPGKAEVIIAVEDSGPGIPMELRAQLFEPFFTTKETGTGVGLALVQEVARSHGGQVGVVAGQHGDGARFEISLPAPGNH